jgi:cysteine desulfurase/selenocysteine lyase
VLYGKQSILEQMPPFMCGGDMVDRVSFERTTYAPLPLKFEAGTANYVGAIGLGEAVRYLEGLDKQAVEAHEKTLLKYGEELLSSIDGLRIYGQTEDKCSILSFNVEGVHHYDMGMILDKLGVAVRTGQHCAEPVMQHYGVTGMCRASIAMYNTREDMEALHRGVERAVRMLK